MNPEDAVQAFQILDPRRAIGFHRGTFRLTTEGIEEPVRDLKKALVGQGIDLARCVATLPGQVWASAAG